MSVHNAVERPSGIGRLGTEPVLRVVGGSAHRRLGGARPGSHSAGRSAGMSGGIVTFPARHGWARIAAIAMNESRRAGHRESVVGPPSKRSGHRPVVPERVPAGRLVEVAALEWRGVDLAIKVAAVVLAIMVAAVLGVVFSGRGSIPVGGHAVVQVGDSLWSVASSISEAPSVGVAVADIRELNGLSSDALEAGRSLVLPRY